MKMSDYKKAYIAGGCFWGMEELFRVRPGVVDTEVGYIGGENDHPTYRNHPGHAEGIELTYDPRATAPPFSFRVRTRRRLRKRSSRLSTLPESGRRMP